METIIGRCGLICSKCEEFIKGICKGCNSENPMYKDCPIKECAIEKNTPNCAGCAEFKQCGKLK